MIKQKPAVLVITPLFLLVGLLFSSCSSERIPAAELSPSAPVVQPGLTKELMLTVGFTEAVGFSKDAGFNEEADPVKTNPQSIHQPKRSEIKTFSQNPPEIRLSGMPAGEDFKLLETIPTVSKTGIECRIIIRASETLLSGDSVKITADWAGTKAEAVLEVRKNPADRIDSQGVVTDPAAIDVFVNKQRRMPADYVPPDLVRVEVPTILTFEEVNHLRRAASDALRAMFDAAGGEGYELLARSGYRSYKTQVMLYDLNVREYGEEYAARFSAQPGTSEHQSGLAMDISSPIVNYQLEQSFGETEEGKWVAANAHRFGFIIRYPEGKEDITGYSYEPWHLRYVGKDLAEEIFSRGLTLEEYFQS